MHKFQTIKKGSYGSDVLVLQSLLRALQYVGEDGKPLEIDGDCGSNTVYAINTFQRMSIAYGIDVGTNQKPDGVFGKKCWERLLGV